MSMIEYQIIISEQAAKDMSDIYEYIYTTIGMPQIAMAQFNRIADAIETLHLFPERSALWYGNSRFRFGLEWMGKGRGHGSYSLQLEHDTSYRQSECRGFCESGS